MASEDRYKNFGPITDPGSAEHLELLKSVPDDPLKIGTTVRGLAIHPFLFEHPERYPELERFIQLVPPGQRYREEMEIPTVNQMLDRLMERELSEVLRSRIHPGKRIAVSCAPLSYLTTAIYKAHSVPARVRVGFASWFGGEHPFTDHWVVEHWNSEDKRWVMDDVDGIGTLPGQTWHDLEPGKFTLAADAWRMVRNGQLEGGDFFHEVGKFGLEAIGIQLGADLESILGEEPFYDDCLPDFLPDRIRPSIPDQTLLKFDGLAEVMRHPDRDIEFLEDIWSTNAIFRTIKV
jgi:hypothetical protein